MYKIKLLLIAALFTVACKQVSQTKNNDPRPKSQIDFLNRLKRAKDSIDLAYNNSAAKDRIIANIDKYLIDSLKQFNDWHLIVESISDFSSDGKTFYNIDLTSPIRIDNSVDTISIDNKVDFNFTVSKEPKDKDLLKIKDEISKLSIGDTIKVDGVIFMTDEDMKKLTLSAYFDNFVSKKLTLLAKEINKK